MGPTRGAHPSAAVGGRGQRVGKKAAAADTRARPVSVSGGRGAGRAAGPRPKSGQGRGGLVAAHVGSAEGERVG